MYFLIDDTQTQLTLAEYFLDYLDYLSTTFDVLFLQGKSCDKREEVKIKKKMQGRE